MTGFVVIISYVSKTVVWPSCIISTFHGKVRSVTLLDSVMDCGLGNYLVPDRPVADNRLDRGYIDL